MGGVQVLRVCDRSVMISSLTVFHKSVFTCKKYTMEHNKALDASRMKFSRACAASTNIMWEVIISQQSVLKCEYPRLITRV